MIVADRCHKAPTPGLPRAGSLPSPRDRGWGRNSRLSDALPAHRERLRPPQAPGKGWWQCPVADGPGKPACPPARPRRGRRMHPSQRRPAPHQRWQRGEPPGIGKPLVPYLRDIVIVMPAADTGAEIEHCLPVLRACQMHTDVHGFCLLNDAALLVPPYQHSEERTS